LFFSLHRDKFPFVLQILFQTVQRVLVLFEKQIAFVVNVEITIIDTFYFVQFIKGFYCSQKRKNKGENIKEFKIHGNLENSQV